VFVTKCLVNGSLAPAGRQAVEDGLRRLYAERFGLAPQSLRVEFTEIATGLWYTAGEPSRASMVLGSVPAGTPQAVRVALMDEIAKMFSAATGAPYDDVMVVAADRVP
jgi:phenylpyruvate tautomerase PptA (4-oxalocrotonate tautomerase family)